jgi:hypothetical protein
MTFGRKHWTPGDDACGVPEFVETERGKRCRSVCEGGRWRFHKDSACAKGEGAEDEGDVGGDEEQQSAVPVHRDVVEFSGFESAEFAGLEKLEMPPIPMNTVVPVSLMPIPGFETEPRPRMRRRRRPRRVEE